MTDQNPHTKDHFDQSTPATATFNFQDPKDRDPPPKHRFPKSTPATVIVFVNPNDERGVRLVAPEIGKEFKFKPDNVIQSALSTIIFYVEGPLYFNHVGDLTGTERYKISTVKIGYHKAYTRIEFFQGEECVAEFVSDYYDPSAVATQLKDEDDEGVWTDSDPASLPGEQRITLVLASFRLEARKIHKEYDSDNFSKYSSPIIARTVEGTLYWNKDEDLTGHKEYKVSTVPIEPPKAYITIEFFKERKCVAEFVSESFDLSSDVRNFGAEGSGNWSKIISTRPDENQR